MSAEDLEAFFVSELAALANEEWGSEELSRGLLRIADLAAEARVEGWVERVEALAGARGATSKGGWVDCMLRAGFGADRVVREARFIDGKRLFVRVRFVDVRGREGYVEETRDRGAHAVFTENGEQFEPTAETAWEHVRCVGWVGGDELPWSLIEQDGS